MKVEKKTYTSCYASQHNIQSATTAVESVVSDYYFGVKQPEAGLFRKVDPLCKTSAKVRLDSQPCTEDS